MCYRNSFLLVSLHSSSLKKETSVQTAEMKRLEDSLRELKQQFGTTSHNYEASERQRRKLTEDLLHSEERASKLQGACDELLQEKTTLNEKISSMNEASIQFSLVKIYYTYTTRIY